MGFQDPMATGEARLIQVNSSEIPLFELSSLVEAPFSYDWCCENPSLHYASSSFFSDVLIAKACMVLYAKRNAPSMSFPLMRRSRSNFSIYSWALS